MRRSLLLMAFVGIYGASLATAVWYPVSEENAAPADPQAKCHSDAETWHAREVRLGACTHRIEARARIARKLLDGRLALLEAADRYRDLNETAIDFDWYSFRQTFAGQSDEERICRQVISSALRLVEDDPKQMAAVRDRLESQLNQHLANGTLQFSR